MAGGAPHDARAYMRRALELAREGWGQTAPNPMVGAVVVRDGHVVGEGYHSRFGGPHAEIVALAEAGDAARGATLFVTLEPCRHHGKTPPCTDAIIAAGIKRVVIAALDPTREAGGGADILRKAGIDAESGVLESEARELNAPFFFAARSDLPWTTLKLAVSLEMAIADKRGTTSSLTGPESRTEVHRMRAANDAVAVGAGTILADDSQLTVRDAARPRVLPTRVVFDRRLRTPREANVVVTARETPTTIVTTDASLRSAKARELEGAGVRLIGAVDLPDGFRQLRALGIRALLVEGGAMLAASVLAAGLVHRLAILQAPVTLGPNALHAFDGATPDVLRALEGYPVLEKRQLGRDTMTTYAVADL